MIFLIHYDASKNLLVSVLRFSDDEREKAVATRLELELDLASKSSDHEVVMLEAPNESQIRQTHGRYFGLESHS
jgi:hypothetical protein